MDHCSFENKFGYMLGNPFGPRYSSLARISGEEGGSENPQGFGSSAGKARAVPEKKPMLNVMEVSTGILMKKFGNGSRILRDHTPDPPHRRDDMVRPPW